MDDLHDDAPQFDSDDDELDWEEVYVPLQPPVGSVTPDTSLPVTPTTSTTIEITLESRKAKKDKQDAL